MAPFWWENATRYSACDESTSVRTCASAHGSSGHSVGDHHQMAINARNMCTRTRADGREETHLLRAPLVDREHGPAAQHLLLGAGKAAHIRAAARDCVSVRAHGDLTHAILL